MTFWEEFKANPRHGFKTSHNFSHWKEMLEKWCEVHERFRKIVPSDGIFWYRERPNLGALAAAAWLVGWCALDEFELDKKRKYGRGDLYVASQEFEFYVEAKFVYSGEGRIKRVVDSMKDARKDAKKVDLDDDDSTPRVGVVFAAPSIPESDRRPLETALEEFVKAMEEKMAPDAVAWCFPPCEKVLSDEGRDYPGIFLFAKDA
jgi:hypothetical protein